MTDTAGREEEFRNEGPFVWIPGIDDEQLLCVVSLSARRTVESINQTLVKLIKISFKAYLRVTGRYKVTGRTRSMPADHFRHILLVLIIVDDNQPAVVCVPCPPWTDYTRNGVTHQAAVVVGRQLGHHLIPQVSEEFLKWPFVIFRHLCDHLYRIVLFVGTIVPPVVGTGRRLGGP